METVRFLVFVCTKCKFVSTLKCKTVEHVARTQCNPAPILECQASVVLAHQGADGDAPRKVSKHVTLDVLQQYMLARVPCGIGMIEDDMETFGIDERIRYLCEDRPELLDKVFEVRDPVKISVKLFCYLWGDQAPLPFRTIFYRNKIVYELIKYDDIKEYASKQDVDELMIYMFKAFLEIAEAIRNRGLGASSDRAAEYIELMERKDCQLPTLDVMYGTEIYEKYRRKCSASVDFKNKLESALKKVLFETTLWV